MVWCQFVVEVVVLVTTVIEPPGGYTRHAATAEAGGAAKTDGRTAAPFSSPSRSLAVSLSLPVSLALSAAPARFVNVADIGHISAGASLLASVP